MRKKKNKFTEKELDILYQCWKDGNTYKERLGLVEEKLPNISSFVGLKLMRVLAKTDSKWVGWTTRQKNKIEKEKSDRRSSLEKKKAEAAKRMEDREENKKKKEIAKKKKNRYTNIQENLKCSDIELVESKIKPKFFFCNVTCQYVNNISCIFRAFSSDYGFSHNTACDKCSKIDKYVEVIEEMINARETTTQIQKQRVGRNTSSTRRSKVKKKNPHNRAKKTK